MRVHLDLIGGLAGDMFAAALLDAAPALEAGLHESLGKAGLPPGVAARLVAHHDGTLQGHRFEVQAPHEDGHGHHPWRAIRDGLERSELAPGVKARAIAIFALLAQAEGRVHGVSPEEVAFHEVGAWDSVADIVAAAHLVDAIGATSWSASAVPLGSGRVRTAHGVMPVPAPATALLLEGFETLDDGIAGERVTPTGAAILRHLVPPAQHADGRARRLGRSGVGFGTRRLPGLPNCVRALFFEEAEPIGAGDAVAVIEFEIDDQTGEDLALGLDRIRALPGVVDALQTPAFGKKNRLVAAIRILVEPAALDAAVRACFEETTTIGLRTRIERRRVLARRTVRVAITGSGVEGSGVGVKIAERPGGESAKADADALAGIAAHARRGWTRAAVETAALAGRDEA